MVLMLDFRFDFAKIMHNAEIFFKKMHFFLACSKINVFLPHQNNIKIISSMETKEFEFKGFAMNGFIALFVELAIIALSVWGFIAFANGQLSTPSTIGYPYRR